MRGERRGEERKDEARERSRAERSLTRAKLVRDESSAQVRNARKNEAKEQARNTPLYTLRGLDQRASGKCLGERSLTIVIRLPYNNYYLITFLLASLVLVKNNQQVSEPMFW